MRIKKFVTLILILVLLLQPISAFALDYSGSTSYASGKYYSALTAVVLTGRLRTDIVNIARSQVGYQEGSSSSQLSGEIKGDGNYTEYGRWYGLQDMWCAMFVSWCADTAGVPQSVIPSHSFTVEGLNKFIEWGRAYTRAQVSSGKYTPHPGDIIYYKSSRNTNKTNHVGIVTSYSGTTVYTVEGNTSSATISTNGGAVCSKSYDISNTYIVYICSPDYDSVQQGQEIFGGNVVYFPQCDSAFESLADALISVGVDGSYENRKKIASANGISDYTGTTDQNVHLLQLLKDGALINPDGGEEDSKFFPACANSYTSLADALESIGVDASYEYRTEIAFANQIIPYSGTIDQNAQMLSLLKSGKLFRPISTQTPIVSYFPACDASADSLTDALESVGAESSMIYRKKIASANGVENYTGTAEQNTELLSLLKEGKLIVPQEIKDTNACGCGAEYLEHIKIAETCTENGAEYDRCSKCNIVSNLVVIKACGHAYTQEITQPTCTKDGIKTYTCTCGDTYSEIIPSTGHSWSDWTILVNPSVENEGKMIQTCSGCSEENVMIIPKLLPDCPENVTLNKHRIVAFPSDVLNLEAVICPSTAKNKSVIWSSLNPNIAIVSGGNVTALKPGSTVITVTTVDGNHSDFCLIHVVGLTAKNQNTVIDNNNHLLYGFVPFLVNIDDYVEPSDGITLDYTTQIIGTGTVVNLMCDDEFVDAYTVVVFGDVNGDGVYDGNDAFIVNCLANGMLTKEQVGEAQYMAADCNHDGIINQDDVDILIQAGLLLTNVTQTDEMDEVFEQYAELIDQSPEMKIETNKFVNLFQNIISLFTKFFEIIKTLFQLV